MKIADDKVVSFHYQLEVDGNQIEDSTQGEQPMMYLHGHRNIVPGLESELEGKSAGDELSVQVPPESGYGEYRDDLRGRIPLKRLKGSGTLKPGMTIRLETQQGPRNVQIVKVGKFNVDVDANHPLAGRPLQFHVKVVDVRDAHESEIAHGHVHADGNHEHG